MAVNFVARKCTQCAGKLEYIKEKKIWRCLYCGAEIEREEQYDGLFTIKNVVRQSLLDTAYRRLESASKNLIECEKIDSRYVGTLIAKISYDMIRVITPGACDQKDVRAVFAQLKKNYDLLKDMGDQITDEEEALYEFLEESDIFATLVLVYDSLGDGVRRDFALGQLSAKEVYSKPANGNLLSYALKNGNVSLADEVIANSDNLDIRPALGDVMARYPDGPEKGNRIASLITAGEPDREMKKLVENYLSETSDGVLTKSRASISAMEKGILISSDLIMEHVVKDADPETVKATLKAFCRVKISDDDVIKILSFAFDCNNMESACGAMDCLKDSGQYVLVPAKLVIAMLFDRRTDGGYKLSLLKKSFEFKMDPKSFESVLTNYLCNNVDSPEDRKPLLDCLIEHASNIPTQAVENYVLKCKADGENKPAVVKAIFDKGLNVSFFNDLLSRYMTSSPDSREVKAAITDILSGIGLKIDPACFTEYICSSQDELPAKMQFIKKMISNGSQLRADAANAYLEKTPPEQFSPELFTMIFSPASMFSAKAVGNYLLRCRDRESVKAENLRTILEHSSADISHLRYEVTHLGNRISCNLLQAYLLTTSDSAPAAAAVADCLINAGRLKINDEMNVSGAGMKMKKYALANRSQLSEAADSVFEKYKVYTMFF